MTTRLIALKKYEKIKIAKNLPGTSKYRENTPSQGASAL